MFGCIVSPVSVSVGDQMAIYKTHLFAHPPFWAHMKPRNSN